MTRLWNITYALAVVVISGCATQPSAADRHDSEVMASTKAVRAAIDQQFKRVDVLDTPYVSPPISSHREAGGWLRGIQVSFDEPVQPLDGNEVLRMFHAQGINIVSQLPLDQYQYAGFGLDATDAYTALQAVLGSMGLDFNVDEQHKLIEIVPIPTRTWRLNIGPRKADFLSQGFTGAVGGAGGASGAGGAAGGAGGAAGAATASAGSAGSNGLVGVTASARESSKSKLDLTDDFWAQLQDELTRRLVVMAPVRHQHPTQGAFALPVPMGGRVPPPTTLGTGGGTNSSNLFTEIPVGRVSINQSTGAVTVQAPRLLLKSIGAYLNEINRELNTRLVFEGRILLITGNDQTNEGINLNLFRQFGRRYGLTMANNAFPGGLTITPAGNGSPLSAVVNTPLVSSNILGIVRPDNLLQAFDAFVESHDNVKTLQKPFLSTTSGVPVVVSQFDRTYVNNISQSTTANTSTTSTATQNQLVPFQFGTSLRLAPRYNAKNGTIRIDFALSQTTQSGTETVNQIVTGANGAPQSITTAIPLDRKIDLSGETLVHSGDMIVLGGQIVRTDDDASSGFTGFLESPLKYLLGSRQHNYTESVYYVALQVRAINMAEPLVAEEDP